jgi:hypothetical protein
MTTVKTETTVVATPATMAAVTVEFTPLKNQRVADLSIEAKKITTPELTTIKKATTATAPRPFRKSFTNAGCHRVRPESRPTHHAGKQPAELFTLSRAATSSDERGLKIRLRLRSPMLPHSG